VGDKKTFLNDNGDQQSNHAATTLGAMAVNERNAPIKFALKIRLVAEANYLESALKHKERDEDGLHCAVGR
jgi:hypothetical protein